MRVTTLFLGDYDLSFFESTLASKLLVISITHQSKIPVGFLIRFTYDFSLLGSVTQASNISFNLSNEV